MTKLVTVAATQMACTRDSEANIENAKKLIRQSAGEGAQIILIQELFESNTFAVSTSLKNSIWQNPIKTILCSKKCPK